MDMNERIKKILQEAGLSESPDTNDQDLTQLGLDSLILVMFVVAAEKEFRIKINPQLALIENFQTVDKIRQLLKAEGAK